MKKHYPSKLDPFAEQLDHWFGVENMTLAQAIDRLHELGCDVSQGNLSHWCRARRRQQCQEQLLHAGGETQAGEGGTSPAGSRTLPTRGAPRPLTGKPQEDPGR